MGLLSKGTPLSWEQSKAYHDYIKKHGIIQFLNLYRAYASRENDVFLWGDEVEHMLVTVDPTSNTARLSLRAPEILEQLDHIIASHPPTSPPINAHFVPEYGRHMIEGTPARPYGGYTSDLRMVEPNMRLRRRMVQALLQPNEYIMTLTSFPLLGVGHHTQPPCTPYGPIAQSLYISDSVIGPHPRFATLSRNIRIRRGSKVCIRVPLFQDSNTRLTMEAQLAARQKAREERKEESKDEPLIPEALSSSTKPVSAPSPNASQQLPNPPSITSATNLSATGDEVYPPIPSCECLPAINELEEIHMDAMAFGMGACCLQVTFQTRSIREARHLYDHLAVLSPIMLALSAATPFHRGRIADTDVRWTVISQAVDDRTNKERGLEGLEATELIRKATLPDYEKPLTHAHNTEALSPRSRARHPQRLHKSRYDSISTYLSLEADLDPAFNDIPCEQDKQSYDELIAAGIDPLLAKHISHLFVRDPLVIYDESIIQDDEKSSDHFENLQSTNWQTVRFKPPPPLSTGPPMGWRVEFRTMEVQLTDFENAAFTVFVALISRAILFFSLNFYLPISLVDDNLHRAHARDAIHTQRFHWRRVVKDCPPDDQPCADQSASPAYEPMTIAEIMTGKPDCGYPGLIPLVRTYLDMIHCDKETLAVVNRYLELLTQRATGQLLTAASWLRKFVEVHPEYRRDSQLTQTVVADLMRTVEQIQSGKIEVTQLMGQLRGMEEDVEGAGEVEGEKVELKGAPRRLDLKDEVCCKEFREFLKKYEPAAAPQARQDGRSDVEAAKVH